MIEWLKSEISKLFWAKWLQYQIIPYIYWSFGLVTNFYINDPPVSVEGNTGGTLTFFKETHPHYKRSLKVPYAGASVDQASPKVFHILLGILLSSPESCYG